MIKCCVCEQSFKKINVSHLKFHQMSMVEYRSKYPTAILVSDEAKTEMSKSLMGHVVSPETGRKISESNMGRIISDATRQKISVSSRGKFRSSETRRKLSEALKGKPHPWCAGDKSPMRNPEICKRQHAAVSRTLSGKPIPHLNGDNHWTRKPEKVSQMQAGIDRMNRSRKKQFTSIENTIAQVLDGIGISYERNGVLLFLPRNYKYHRFDFVLSEKKLVIEVDGCYWHGCPEHYPTLRQHAHGFDVYIGTLVVNAGWKIIRLWQHDIEANKVDLLKLVS